MNRVLLTTIATVTTVSSLCAQWTQVTPSPAPSARAGAAFSAGPTGDLLMFGGDTGGFSPSNQNWRYDGTNWTQFTPATSPNGRAGSAMVYDPNAGVVWLYGGLNSSPIGGASKNDTWQFDGTTWTQMVITGATPGGLGLHAMAFDTVNNVAVVYGGMASSMLSIDSSATWEWNGTGWTQTATTPGSNPGPLERASMCFHQGLGKTVLFGGLDVQGFYNNTTWTYDAAANTWAALNIPGSPAARTGATMAYDSIRGVCVLTGGADPTDPNGTTYFADTWEFDGTTWTQIATAPTGSRLSAMMEFHAASNRMVLFGGVNFATFTYHGTTWEWEVGTFGSGCAGTNGTPALSASSTPHLGLPWTANVANLNPLANIAILVFGFTPVPGVDLGFLPMPGCLLFTTPDIMMSITGASGAANWTWPAVTGSLGQTFYGQALCFDPTVNGFGFTISNAISATIGN